MKSEKKDITTCFAVEKKLYPMFSTLPENIYDKVQECDVILRCNRKDDSFL